MFKLKKAMNTHEAKQKSETKAKYCIKGFKGFRQQSLYREGTGVGCIASKVELLYRSWIVNEYLIIMIFNEICITQKTSKGTIPGSTSSLFLCSTNLF